jgi:ABC-type multidrug transport system permease subunit
VLRGDITRIESELDSAYSDAYCEQAGSMDILNNTFFSRWKSICGDILSLNKSMATLDNDLVNQTAYLAALNSSAAQTQANLTQVRAKIAEVQGRLGALSELSELNDTLAYMERSVEEFQLVQEEASANLNETSGILDSVSARIADLKLGAAGAKGKLDSLVSRDPRSIITPLTLSTSSLFGPIRYLDAMFPAILAVILMFVTVLFSAVTVIREKQTGTLKRVLLSPATSIEFVLGKVALVLAVAVLQAAMLLLVAGTVFVIRINWALVPYAFAVVALASVTFASIGMIIAALSDSENTALLAALVVCIPMLFLSGVFFPRELMIAPVALISLASPLTHAVVLLEQFLVYSVDPFAAGAFMAGLLLWTIASLALSARLVSGLRMK